MTINPIHPGEYLKEILEEEGISYRKFAKHINTSSTQISLIARGLRPVSAEMAYKFGQALGTSATYWQNLQASYDLALVEDAVENNAQPITPLFA